MEYSREQIELELAAIKAGEPRKWTEFGILFDSVNRSEYWRRDSKFFRQWLEDFGEEIGLKRATLWRYISATRKYKYMCKFANAQYEHRNYPSVEDLPGHVSPEKIEILEKLSRVMPQGDVLDMMSGIVDGTLQRAVLRDKWEGYRPALKGKTARGSVALGDIRVDPDDKFQADKLLEGKLYSALKNGEFNWLVESMPLFYKIILNVVPDNVTDSQLVFKEMPCSGIDAVALIKMNEKTPLELHAIEISASIDASTIENLSTLKWYSDKVWLVVHEAAIRDGSMEMIPNKIGLLSINDAGVIQVKQMAETGGCPNSPLLNCMLRGVVIKLCGVA